MIRSSNNNASRVRVWILNDEKKMPRHSLLIRFYSSYLFPLLFDNGSNRKIIL